MSHKIEQPLLQPGSDGFDAIAPVTDEKLQPGSDGYDAILPITKQGIFTASPEKKLSPEFNEIERAIASLKIKN